MKQVCIIGAGAAGSVCAYILLKGGVEVTLFDINPPLLTLLPTGGGRCNLAHAEYDFRELAKNYPRGEKFLYSVFSEFSTYDTIDLFEELGIKTYIQDDNRIFPVSDSAKDVRSKILNSIADANFVKELVKSVLPLEDGYKLITDKAEYFFSTVIIATGGTHNKVISGLKHNLIPFKPSLTGLMSDTKGLSGIVLNNVYSKDINSADDLLFTHKGISGPLAYKISSIKSRDSFPYKLTFDLCNNFDFQDMLNANPHKDIKNILSNIFPHRFAEYISGEYANTKAHCLNGIQRDFILNKIHNFELNIFSTVKGEETVCSGGFDLKEINSKTMESKLYKELYVIGEVLDIDGFCGGFNLQNAWSTAYIAASSIINNL